MAKIIQTLIEVTEQFQEMLKLAGADGVLESWGVEVILQNLAVVFNEDIKCHGHLIFGLHSLLALLIRKLEELGHESQSETCGCGWDMSHIQESQHGDIQRYCSGTIIRWAQGKCYVLLAPKKNQGGRKKIDSNDLCRKSENNECSDCRFSFANHKNCKFHNCKEYTSHITTDSVQSRKSTRKYSHIYVNTKQTKRFKNANQILVHKFKKNKANNFVVYNRKRKISKINGTSHESEDKRNIGPNKNIPENLNEFEETNTKELKISNITNDNFEFPNKDKSNVIQNDNNCEERIDRGCIIPYDKELLNVTEHFVNTDNLDQINDMIFTDDGGSKQNLAEKTNSSNKNDIIKENIYASTTNDGLKSLMLLIHDDGKENTDDKATVISTDIKNERINSSLLDSENTLKVYKCTTDDANIKSKTNMCDISTGSINNERKNFDNGSKNQHTSSEGNSKRSTVLSDFFEKKGLAEDTTFKTINDYKGIYDICYKKHGGTEYSKKKNSLSIDENKSEELMGNKMSQNKDMNSISLGDDSMKSKNIFKSNLCKSDLLSESKITGDYVKKQDGGSDEDSDQSDDDTNSIISNMSTSSSSSSSSSSNSSSSDDDDRIKFKQRVERAAKAAREAEANASRKAEECAAREAEASSAREAEAKEAIAVQEGEVIAAQKDKAFNTLDTKSIDAHRLEPSVTSLTTSKQADVVINNSSTLSEISTQISLTKLVIPHINQHQDTDSQQQPCLTVEQQQQLSHQSHLQNSDKSLQNKPHLVPRESCLPSSVSLALESCLATDSHQQISEKQLQSNARLSLEIVEKHLNSSLMQTSETNALSDVNISERSHSHHNYRLDGTNMLIASNQLASNSQAVDVLGPEQTMSLPRSLLEKNTDTGRSVSLVNNLVNHSTVPMISGLGIACSNNINQIKFDQSAHTVVGAAKQSINNFDQEHITTHQNVRCQNINMNCQNVTLCSNELSINSHHSLSQSVHPTITNNISCNSIEQINVSYQNINPTNTNLNPLDSNINAQHSNVNAHGHLNLISHTSDRANQADLHQRLHSPMPEFSNQNPDMISQTNLSSSHLELDSRQQELNTPKPELNTHHSDLSSSHTDLDSCHSELNTPKPNHNSITNSQLHNVGSHQNDLNISRPVPIQSQDIQDSTLDVSDRHPDDLQAAQGLADLHHSQMTVHTLSNNVTNACFFIDNDETNRKVNNSSCQNDNMNTSNADNKIKSLNLVQALVEKKNYVNVSFGSFGNVTSTITKLQESSIKCQRKDLGKVLECTICGKVFNRLNKLQHHLNIHTGNRPWKCLNCNKGFIKSEYLQKHELTCTVPDNERQYSCYICQKGFGLLDSLRAHLVTHAANKPFPCDVCGRSFAMKHTLDTHKAQHTGNRPWICNDCGRSYVSKSKLNAHMKAHTGELLCTVCDKLFTSVDSYKRHCRLHEDKNLPCCNICNKKFPTPSKLKQHQSTHESSKTLKCNICSLTFNNHKKLSTHKSLHNIKDNNSKCQECGKFFGKASQLRRHITTHNKTILRKKKQEASLQSITQLKNPANLNIPLMIKSEGNHLNNSIHHNLVLHQNKRVPNLQIKKNELDQVYPRTLSLRQEFHRQKQCRQLEPTIHQVPEQHTLQHSLIPNQQGNNNAVQHHTDKQHLQHQVQFSHLPNNENQTIQLQQHHRQDHHRPQQHQGAWEESIGTHLQGSPQSSSRLRVRRVPPFMTGVRFTPGSCVPASQIVASTQIQQQK